MNGRQLLTVALLVLILSGLTMVLTIAGPGPCSYERPDDYPQHLPYDPPLGGCDLHRLPIWASIPILGGAMALLVRSIGLGSGKRRSAVGNSRGSQLPLTKVLRAHLTRR